MFSFIKASVDDCLTIQDLAKKIWEPTYRKILTREQIDYMFEMMYSISNLKKQMEIEHHQFFIIKKEKRPVGYLSIETVKRNFYIFQKIYSLPEIHGQGVGRYIINQGIAYIKSIYSGDFTIELNVNRNNPAVGFYKHLGFYEYATRDHPIGNNFYMNDYIMHKDIHQS